MKMFSRSTQLRLATVPLIRGIFEVKLLLRNPTTNRIIIRVDIANDQSNHCFLCLGVAYACGSDSRYIGFDFTRAPFPRRGRQVPDPNGDPAIDDLTFVFI